MTITSNRQGMDAFNATYEKVMNNVVTDNFVDADSALIRLRVLAEDVNDSLKDSIDYASEVLKRAMENAVILDTSEGTLDGSWYYNPDENLYELKFRAKGIPPRIIGVRSPVSHGGAK